MPIFQLSELSRRHIKTAAQLIVCRADAILVAGMPVSMAVPDWLAAVAEKLVRWE
jgi:hypothetical protein